MASQRQGQTAAGILDQQVGPPYLPAVWLYGATPTIVPDVIVCSLFLLAYLAAAIIHKVVFLKNKFKGQKFVMSAMAFGFCFVRLITFSTRIAWGVLPANASLALVSNIFLNAGIPILYIINLVFVHRITRAQHPRFGWHRSLSILGRVTIALIILTLVLLIYSGIQASMTRDDTIQQKLRIIQLYGATFNTAIAVVPLLMLFIGVIIPKRVRTEKFGVGRFRVKVAVLLVSSSLLTIRTAYATTIAYFAPVPLSEPMPWYYSKAVFYPLQLVTELIVVYVFIFVRINKIFYTPDGLPRGSYIDLTKSVGQLANKPLPYAERNFETATTLRPYGEEELLQNQDALAETLHYSSTSLLLDNQSGKWKLDRSSAADLYSPALHHESEDPSRRMSSASNYYYAPMSDESGQPRGYRLPTTWSKARYYGGKEQRDGGKTGSADNDDSNIELEMNREHDSMYKARLPKNIGHKIPSSAGSQMRQIHTNRSIPAELERLSQVSMGSTFQERVDQVMRDCCRAPQTGVNEARPRRPRTLSHPRRPSRLRFSSSPISPIPSITHPKPPPAVSQPQGSPSFEGVRFHRV
ncbi:uncharacterized protein PV09_04629 [Verruconis gallopava]|uniref:Uncharacterized protein n=1 Tax=Verruconis gallopava TaxID=253628 RepID=A0A0D2AYU7_9PEZI|nr:uncharacterized protein PV09_04629 [Verruconis gallopava]KIW04339.1 hypothetical protein PV09_04629 [Verruconis gallopava]